mgnify:CR=1 FL=1
MKINTALILCAGLGKRLNPLTLETPKPLLKLGDKTLLERCINLIKKLGIKKILLNSFHLNDKISDYIKRNNFSLDIQIIDDGEKILDTGGGLLNMINHSQDNDFLIFNPDTLWSNKNIDEITKMQKFYFSNKLNNILLVAKSDLSYDPDLKEDFELIKNLLKKNEKKNVIFIGCQILNKNLFKNYKVKDFPISEIWNELLKNNDLYGYESLSKFYHVTNLKMFKKLQDF